MKPVKFKQYNYTIAKDSKVYMPFPIYSFGDPDGTVVGCWKLSFIDRLKVLFTGVIWHEVLTFNRALQPQKLSIDKPKMD